VVIDDSHVDQALKKLDLRLERVEQFLPSVATKADLAEAIAPLATKAELAEAIAPLARRDEVNAAFVEFRDAIYEFVGTQIRELREFFVTREDSFREYVERRFERLERADRALAGRQTALEGRVLRLEAQRRRKA
jgi:hypothetical protein